MERLSWIVGAGLVGVNLHALAALVAGLRTHDADAVSMLSRRCAWSAGGFVLLSGAGVAMTFATAAPHGNDPASQAGRLGMMMAVGINAAAFTLLGSALPLTAAIILARRARRAR